MAVVVSTATLAALVGLSITSLPALADPGSDPQKAADAAASSYEEAQVRVGELDAEIRQLEQQIATLRAAAQRRAVSAYKDTGFGADLFTASEAPIDAARREKLLEEANAGDNDAVARLAAAQKGLPRDNTPAPASPGGLICPVHGPLSFVDSWHAPRPGGRPHEGVDLMAPRGTPNVATVSGSVTMKSGSVSGNGVYLHGDNGDLYYYFHLDSYEGGARHVDQGEVIGYTGNTGDASGGATHTHFEVHPGGGGPVNPYPVVRPIC